MSGGTIAALYASSGPNRLGRFDPRIRLVSALLFCLALPAVSTLSALALATAFALTLCLVSGLPPRAIARRLLAVETFVLVLVLLLPLTVPGPALASFGPLTLSSTGLVKAGLIAGRTGLAALVLLALLSDLGATGIARTLSGLGLPARLVLLFDLAIRYIALIGEEYQRLRRAMLLRGFALGANRHTWKSLGNLFGMVLLRSLERAERVRWAMLCRGYAGRAPRALFPPLALADLALFALTIAAAGTMLTLERLP